MCAHVCMCVCKSNKSRLCGDEHTQRVLRAYGHRRWIYYSLAEFTLHHKGFLSRLLPHTLSPRFPLLYVAPYSPANGAGADLPLLILRSQLV